MRNHKKANGLLAHLNQRVQGMISIDAKLDLGGGVSVAAGKKSSEDLAAAIARLSQAENLVAAAQLQLKALEAGARDLSDRILSGVGSRYGKDSEEYRKAGGKPKSQRRRRARGEGATAAQAQKQVLGPAFVAPAAENGVGANGHA